MLCSRLASLLLLLLYIMLLDRFESFTEYSHHVSTITFN